ncbi:hypothetical protein [Alishewanella aestuarii]|uniref:hypothetical protein n=1 Tax=Alishewanella aestuarii TaxID=453835 RepID=UPI0012EAFFB9|nr:hypothetical protein [Alishewanella aestuarii]
MKTSEFEFGTETNPLVLEKINTPRPRISRCVRFNPEARNSLEPVSIDFGKFRGRKERVYDIEQIFLKNLLSNPNLSLNALRLAIWMVIQIHMWPDEQQIFIISHSDEVSSMNKLCIGHPRGHLAIYLNIEFIDLLPKLKKMSINFTRTDVIAALQELHDFQYLTVTEVKYENSYLGRKARKKEAESKNRAQDIKQPTFLTERCSLVCVTLTKQLYEKNFSGKWTPTL